MPSPGTTKYPAALDTAVDLLEVRNEATATLLAPLADVMGTVMLDHPERFPESGSISLGEEHLLYDSKDDLGGLHVFARGADGSAAQAHAAGTVAEQRVTALHHTVLRDAIIALEAKLGANVSQPEAEGEYLRATNDGGSDWGALRQEDILLSIANGVVPVTGGYYAPAPGQPITARMVVSVVQADETVLHTAGISSQVTMAPDTNVGTTFSGYAVMGELIIPPTVSANLSGWSEQFAGYFAARNSGTGTMAGKIYGIQCEAMDDRAGGSIYGLIAGQFMVTIKGVAPRFGSIACNATINDTVTSTPHSPVAPTNSLVSFSGGVTHNGTATYNEVLGINLKHTGGGAVLNGAGVIQYMYGIRLSQTSTNYGTQVINHTGIEIARTDTVGLNSWSLVAIGTLSRSRIEGALIIGSASAVPTAQAATARLMLTGNFIFEVDGAHDIGVGTYRPRNVSITGGYAAGGAILPTETHFYALRSWAPAASAYGVYINLTATNAQAVFGYYAVVKSTGGLIQVVTAQGDNGGAASILTGLAITTNNLTGASLSGGCFGLNYNLINYNTASISAAAQCVRVSILNLGGGLMSGGGSLFFGRVSNGAGATISAAYGLNLSTWANTGTVTVSYGIYMDASIDIGTTRWAIYSASASKSYFAATVLVGGNAPPNLGERLWVTGGGLLMDEVSDIGLAANWRPRHIFAAQNISAGQNLIAAGAVAGGTVAAATSVTAGTDVVAGQHVRAAGSVYAGQNQIIAFENSSSINDYGDGALLFWNYNQDGFTKIMFGGDGAAQPALFFGDGLYIDARSANDSTHAIFRSNAAEQVEGMVARGFLLDLQSGAAQLVYSPPVGFDFIPTKVVLRKHRPTALDLTTINGRLQIGSSGGGAAIGRLTWATTGMTGNEDGYFIFQFNQMSVLEDPMRVIVDNKGLTLTLSDIYTGGEASVLVDLFGYLMPIY